MEISGSDSLNPAAAYRGIMDAISVSTEITTSNVLLNDLFTSGGMEGMLGTIWLIICAMVFGGIMDAIGALSRISNALLQWAQTSLSTFCQYRCLLFGDQPYRF
jgi:NhaC family Na+:H+ antiporter